MEKKVVLFNLETNFYLGDDCLMTKDYKSAIAFKDEDFALSELSRLKDEMKKLDLKTWCTRTFYKLT